MPGGNRCFRFAEIICNCDSLWLTQRLSFPFHLSSLEGSQYRTFRHFSQSGRFGCAHVIVIAVTCSTLVVEHCRTVDRHRSRLSAASQSGSDKEQRKECPALRRILSFHDSDPLAELASNRLVGRLSPTSHSNPTRRLVLLSGLDTSPPAEVSVRRRKPVRFRRRARPVRCARSEEIG